VKSFTRAALRVRLQGLDRHAGDLTQGRPVRAPRHDAARESYDGDALKPVIKAFGRKRTARFEKDAKIPFDKGKG
jgi:hypothetical protein